MPDVSLGFIGFGEAAFHIVKGLRGAGWPAVAAYDLHSETPGRANLIRKRAAETETRLLPDAASLSAECNWIISAVPANQAEAAIPLLSERHTYIDVNSVSPRTKQRIAATVAGAGARFVEVALMSPVPPHLHRVPILAGGAGAADFQNLMEPFGMRIAVTGAEVGVAAATKMCRSIMVKGMEALITECVLGSVHYGADEQVFASLNESFPGIDWPKLATYMVGRVAEHGERRAREMEEVAATLREAGVDPMMVEATVRRMDWAAALRLSLPANYSEFAEAVRRSTGGVP